MRFQNLEDKAEMARQRAGLFASYTGANMARLPAICDRCGTTFPSGMKMENGVHDNLFTGCKSGPCPKCGGMGSIPDGIYGVLDGLIQFAHAGEFPHKRLEMLEQIALAARKDGWSADQFKEEAEKQAPGAAKLLSWLPSNKDQWYVFIGLLIAALALLQASSGYTLKDLIHADTQQASASVSAQAPVASQSRAQPARQTARPAPHRAQRKIGRNERCPCGSGAKYKRCHGKLS
ncbi:SEC-C domain-containing protein [Burkholderia sp. ZZQ-2]|uniref:SEC-C metal-binding domain-containing protein n=1 Tax=Burkholderia sp. ZZQ-2 TaxID=1661766 RepID=UPI003D6E2299